MRPQDAAFTLGPDGRVLVTRPLVAVLFGVSVQHVLRWQAEIPGLPVAVAGAPHKPTRYDLADAIRWRVARERATWVGGNGHRSKELAQAALAEAQTRRIELELRAREGDVLDRAK